MFLSKMLTLFGGVPFEVDGPSSGLILRPISGKEIGKVILVHAIAVNFIILPLMAMEISGISPWVLNLNCCKNKVLLTVLSICAFGHHSIPGTVENFTDKGLSVTDVICLYGMSFINVFGGCIFLYYIWKKREDICRSVNAILGMRFVPREELRQDVKALNKFTLMTMALTYVGGKTLTRPVPNSACVRTCLLTSLQTSLHVFWDLVVLPDEPGGDLEPVACPHGT